MLSREQPVATADAEKDAAKRKHDSGIGLELQKQNSQKSTGANIPRFYQQHSQLNLGEQNSISTTASGSRARTPSSHQSRTRSFQQTAWTFLSNPARTGPRFPENPDWAAASEEELLKPTTPSMLNKIPSLGWSRPGSRLNHKTRVEDFTASSRSESKRSSTIPGTISSRTTENAFPEGTSEIPTRTQEESAKDHPPRGNAALIDQHGDKHFMTIEEEMQRQLDLQRAVREKMSTGVIGLKSRESTEPDREGKPLQTDYLGLETGSWSLSKPFQLLERRRSVAAASGRGYSQSSQRLKSGLIRKLSMIGIGRRKTAISTGDESGSMGLGRVVEAV